MTWQGKQLNDNVLGINYFITYISALAYCIYISWYEKDQQPVQPIPTWSGGGGPNNGLQRWWKRRILLSSCSLLSAPVSRWTMQCMSRLGTSNAAAQQGPSMDGSITGSPCLMYCLQWFRMSFFCPWVHLGFLLPITWWGEITAQTTRRTSATFPGDIFVYSLSSRLWSTQSKNKTPKNLIYYLELQHMCSYIYWNGSTQ